jgi:GxxExxY protein
MQPQHPLKQETHKIIGCAMEVHNELGSGFLEAVYQEALELEFQIQQVPYERENPLHLQYKGYPLKKTYKPDFFCDNKIIVELKASSGLTSNDLAQCLNYLKAAHVELGLLINFGTQRLEFKRVIFSH